MSAPAASSGSLVEVVVERVVAGGFGLARTAGGVALVRGALPGERVRARLSRRKGVLAGSVAEILEPHPARSTEPLPPGADLPLAYPAQLEIKQALVADALARVAKTPADISPIRPSPSSLGYRTAAQYATRAEGGLAARSPGSRALVPLSSDPLTAEPVAAAFETLASTPLPSVREVAIRGSLHEARAVVGLVGDKRGPFERIARTLVRRGVAGVAWGLARPGARFRSISRVVAGTGELLEDFGGILASVTVRSFAQINPGAAALLYREAVEIAGDGGRAVDLYAGSGVLALHLARAFAEVHAVEISNDAIRRGEADARRLGSRVRFHRADARAVRRWLPADLVAVNPPRAGIDADVIRALVAAAPPRILYVSCDPPTWARDVGRLAAAGYRIAFARPYDFYPYTHHVEVLSLLSR